MPNGLNPNPVGAGTASNFDDTDMRVFTVQPANPPSAPTDGARRTRYATVEEGVIPFDAEIGDRVFRFTRKPNAALQIELARIADEQSARKHVAFITDVLEAMLQTPEDSQELLKRIDATEVTRLINDAMRHMSDRPTIAQQDLPPGQSETTSTTGSSEPGSNGTS